ncbi:hypothetical protein J6590_018394 [Homalodisca vitripennis]|nr:hypothetical protein J6590_018394 [Homalodisca vitripennis]
MIQQGIEGAVKEYRRFITKSQKQIDGLDFKLLKLKQNKYCFWTERNRCTFKSLQFYQQLQNIRVDSQRGGPLNINPKLSRILPLTEKNPSTKFQVPKTYLSRVVARQPKPHAQTETNDRNDDRIPIRIRTPPPPPRMMTGYDILLLGTLTSFMMASPPLKELP